MKRSLAILFIMAPAVAFAKPVITMETLQSGYYEDTECELKDEKSDAFAYCITKCEISYPSVSGIERESYNKALNVKWRKKAEVVACEGQKVDSSVVSEGKGTSELQNSYTVTLNDGKLLGLTENHYWYGAGAAHGMYATTGIILDARTGTELGTNDILDYTKIDALNTYLIETAKKDERTFDSLRETPSENIPPFISDKNREFTLVLDETRGLYALFSIYQIGPYASGEIDIKIPAEFIKHPHILKLYDDKEIRDAQR